MRDFNKEEQYIRAKKRVDDIRGFFIHLLVYIAVNILVSTLKVIHNINNGETFEQAFFDFSTFGLWAAWGIGIAFHGFAVLSDSTKTFYTWKNKKLKHYIEQEVQEFKTVHKYYTEEELEDFSKKDAYFAAKKKLDNLSGFYWHAVVYVVVNIFIYAVLFFVADLSFKEWYTYATAVFWGLGLGIHGLSLFTKNLIFSKQWEQRKIQEYMGDDNEQKGWN